MRRAAILSFQNKTLALKMIKEHGLANAVQHFAGLLGYQPHPMRLALEKLNRSHVLFDEGLLEKTEFNLIIFTHKACPSQPNPVNAKYYTSISASLAKQIQDSISYLNQKYEHKPEYVG